MLYQPDPNYNGPDAFSFQVNDGRASSSVATVTISVLAVNDAPVAFGQSVTTDEDNAVAITLTGSDVDGDALAFVAGVPLHGTLSGTAPNLVYTPAANYNGTDGFSFVANDGQVNSAAATVSITVRGVNDAPVASAQIVTTDEDTAVAITLTGSDLDGDALTFVASVPQHGNLSGTAPNLVYTPAANYNGPDCFTFVANDGKANSAAAKVSITVRPVNDAPVAAVQSVTTDEDTPVAITLAGSDVDGDALAFVAAAPQHGTLAGTAPNLVYKPDANYTGVDCFTFVAKDGKLSSPAAQVNITVRPVNRAPVARAKVSPLYTLPLATNCLAVLAINNSNAPIVLDGSLSTDADNDALQYCWMEGSTTPFATGVKVCRAFCVGSHNLSLVVSDGRLSDMVSFRVEVVTPSAVLEDMVPLIDAARTPKVPHSIYSSLEAAQAAFDTGDTRTALNRLDTLQGKIRNQLAPYDPATAALLNDLIQSLINAVGGH